MSSLTVPSDWFGWIFNWTIAILGVWTIALSFYYAGRFKENKYLNGEWLIAKRKAKLKRILDRMNVEDLESCQS